MPLHSALLPAYGSRSIYANHIDMTKFESADNPGCLDVSITLWRWSRGVSKETLKSWILPQVSQSQFTLLAIEDSKSPGETIVRCTNDFHGQINAEDGRLCQRGIAGKGDVRIG